MRHKIAVAALAGAMFFSAPAFAQASSTATANGSTTIIRPVTIANTSGLSFGRIVKPATGTGTVAIANSADTVSAGAGAVALAGISTSRAKFTIDGEGGQALTVTVPSSFNLVNGDDTLVVTLSPNAAGTQTLSNALGAAGTLALNVGGSFSVPNDIDTGAYTGSFDVTVQYN